VEDMIHIIGNPEDFSQPKIKSGTVPSRTYGKKNAEKQ
jgi:hypothetical protein